jgi:hypothetical protein
VKAARVKAARVKAARVKATRVKAAVTKAVPAVSARVESAPADVIQDNGGNDGFATGNQVAVPINIPINICGNALAILGATDAGAGCESGGLGGLLGGHDRRNDSVGGGDGGAHSFQFDDPGYEGPGGRAAITESGAVQNALR